MWAAGSLSSALAVSSSSCHLGSQHWDSSIAQSNFCISLFERHDVQAHHLIVLLPSGLFGPLKRFEGRTEKPRRSQLRRILCAVVGSGTVVNCTRCWQAERGETVSP